MEPIYYPASEAEAPSPTHVRVYVNRVFVTEIPISDVVTPIRNLSTVFSQGLPVRLELITRDTDDVYQLAVAPMVATTS